MSEPRKGLGRGLSALLGEAPRPVAIGTAGRSSFYLCARLPGRSVAEHAAAGIDRCMAYAVAMFCGDVLAREGWEPKASAASEFPAATDHQRQRLRAVGLGAEDVDEVHDVGHPCPALHEEAVRCPRTELGDRVQMRRSDVALVRVDRHPEHLAADVHARVDAVPGVHEHAAAVSIRIIAFARLAVAVERG